MIGFEAGSFHDELAALLVEKNPHMKGVTGSDITIIDSTNHDASGLAQLTASISGYRGTVVLYYKSLPSRNIQNLYCQTPVYVKVDESGKVAMRDIWYEYQRMSGITPIEGIDDVVDASTMISLPASGLVDVTLYPTLNSPIWINSNITDGATISVGRFHESDLGTLITTKESAPFFNLNDYDDYLKIDANDTMPGSLAPFKMNTDYFGAGLVPVNEIIMWGAELPKELVTEMIGTGTNNPKEVTLSDAGLGMLNEVLVTQALPPLKHAPVFPAGSITTYPTGKGSNYSYIDDAYTALLTSVDVKAYTSNVDDTTKEAYVVKATGAEHVKYNFRSCRVAPANQNTFVYKTA